MAYRNFSYGGIIRGGTIDLDPLEKQRCGAQLERHPVASGSVALPASGTMAGAETVGQKITRALCL